MRLRLISDHISRSLGGSGQDVSRIAGPTGTSTATNERQANLRCALFGFVGGCLFSGLVAVGDSALHDSVPYDALIIVLIGFAIVGFLVRN